MDDRRFDDLTRALGSSTSRRQVLKAVGAAAVGALLAPFARDAAGTAPAAAAAQSVEFAPANDSFKRTWERTDRPVAEGRAVRTWMWGPEAFSTALEEDYQQSPNGKRQVQYFDKSRMEITNPSGDQNSPWYVTNGLLVVELVTGRMQVGDAQFENRSPAQVNVAGDADDPTGPTYATFGPLRSAPAAADNTLLTQRVNRAGVVTNDTSLAQHGVRAVKRVTVPGLDHQIAGPFWTFMNSNGVVYQNGQFVIDKLFQDPFYATGYPITEAYWSRVKIGGNYRDVLMQCFERRCLTYAPDNPSEWQVEAGNVGRHYDSWRYDSPPAPEITIVVVDETREAAIAQTAGADAGYQALVTALQQRGFTVVNRTAIEMSGDLEAQQAVFTEYVGPTQPPLKAVLVYGAVVGVRKATYATITNADGRVLYALYSDGGAVQTVFPPSPAGSNVGSGSPPPAFDRHLLAGGYCDDKAALCDQCQCYLGVFYATALPDDPAECQQTAQLLCMTFMPADAVQISTSKYVATCAAWVKGVCDDNNLGNLDTACAYHCSHDCQDNGCGGSTGLQAVTGICCQNFCTDPGHDANNCGACGHSCGQGKGCCGTGADPCVDVLANKAHCGACGNNCLNNEACVNGNCVVQDQCGGGLPACPNCTECVNGRCLDCLYGCCPNGTCQQQNTCCGGCGNDFTCDGCPTYCCGNGQCNAPGTCCPQWTPCPGVGEPPCCAGDYPICAAGPGGPNCCPAGLPVSCPDNWCCPPGCTCDGFHDCHCDDAISSGIDSDGMSVAGAPGGAGLSITVQ